MSPFWKNRPNNQKKPTYSSVTSSSTSVCQDNVTGTAGSVLFAYDHDSDCIIPGCEWRSIYRADVRSSSWEYLGVTGVTVAFRFWEIPWFSVFFSGLANILNHYDLARWTCESLWNFCFDAIWWQLVACSHDSHDSHVTIFHQEKSHWRGINCWFLLVGHQLSYMGWNKPYKWLSQTNGWGLQPYW